MIGDLRVIDGDAHILESEAALRRYLPARIARRAAPILPVTSWDRDLGGRLGRRTADPQRWLDDFDEFGVDVAVLYPSACLDIAGIREPGLIEAVCRAYNEYAADLCRGVPRLQAMALVPAHRPSWAAAELSRAVTELGLIGGLVTAAANGGNLGDTRLDPLYDVAESLDVGIAVHGGGLSFCTEVFDEFIGLHTVDQPFSILSQLTAILFGGVLERFSRLRLAFLEAGVAWLPWWSARLDRAHELRGRVEAPACVRKPSEYLESGRVVFGVEGDEPGLSHALERFGPSIAMYSSDYPHWDMEFPDSALELARAPFTLELRQAVLSDNATSFYAPRAAALSATGSQLDLNGRVR